MSRVVGPVIGVTDIGRSVNFYVEVLGMRTVATIEGAGFHQVVVSYGESMEAAPSIVLVQAQPCGAVTSQTGYRNVVVFVDDVAQVCEKATAGGHVAKQPTKLVAANKVIAVVRDPEGNEIELVGKG